MSTWEPDKKTGILLTLPNGEKRTILVGIDGYRFYTNAADGKGWVSCLEFKHDDNPLSFQIADLIFDALKQLGTGKDTSSAGEGYPKNWMHCTIHLDPNTGTMNSDGDHRVREWIEQRLQKPKDASIQDLTPTGKIEVGLEYFYCPGCGQHRGHVPGHQDCVICEKVKAHKETQNDPPQAVRGIPYTVSEARGAAREHKNMDQYHKELMLFLCNRVEELEGNIESKEIPNYDADWLDVEPHTWELKTTPHLCKRDGKLYQWCYSDKKGKGCWLVIPQKGTEVSPLAKLGCTNHGIYIEKLHRSDNKEEWTDIIPQGRMLTVSPRIRWRDGKLCQWWESELGHSKGCWVTVGTHNSENGSQYRRATALVAWLIERVDDANPGCTVPDEALVLGKNGLIGEKCFWGPYSDAERFNRKEDAEAAAKIMVPDVKTVAVEHVWS
jgi:hypothetical protein